MGDPVSHAKHVLHTLHCFIRFIDCIASVDLSSRKNDTVDDKNVYYTAGCGKMKRTCGYCIRVMAGVRSRV